MYYVLLEIPVRHDSWAMNQPESWPMNQPLVRLGLVFGKFLARDLYLVMIMAGQLCNHSWTTCTNFISQFNHHNNFSQQSVTDWLPVLKTSS